MKKMDSETQQRNDIFNLTVIVDFIFEDGLLFISVKNISNDPAFKVSIEFNKKIMGVSGRKEISSLPLFRNIEFLAPHKEIKTFLDTSESYFSRKQPEKILIKISYKDKKGELSSGTISHDLSIYREIGYIKVIEEPGYLTDGKEIQNKPGGNI